MHCGSSQQGGGTAGGQEAMEQETPAQGAVPADSPAGSGLRRADLGPTTRAAGGPWRHCICPRIWVFCFCFFFVFLAVLKGHLKKSDVNISDWKYRKCFRNVNNKYVQVARERFPD